MSAIVNGASYRCVWWWDRHFKDDRENVRTEIVTSKGLTADNVHDMMREMQALALASGTRAKNFMWICDISPHPDKTVTAGQRDRMREIIETKRGLKGETYFMIEQEKADGRKHFHLVELRIDLETGKAIPDHKDAEICHAASKQICEEMGWERVASPFDKDREGPRPERAPERWEMYRGMKSGIDPRDIAAQVTELFRQSDSGPAFKAALEDHGYELVTGKRGLLILDQAGHEHSLVRRIEGVNKKQLDAFMRDIDRDALPSLEQAKAAFQERKIAGLEADHATVEREIQWEEALAQAAIEKEKIERRFVEPQPEPETQNLRALEARILDAYVAASGDERAREGEVQPSAPAFAAALENKCIAFAVVTAEESYRSHREREFARAIGRKSQVFETGEIVAVTEPGLLYHRDGEWTGTLRVHKLDQQRAERYLGILSIDKSELKGIDATKSMLDDRAQARAAHRQEIRLENATTINDWAPERSVKEVAGPALQQGGKLAEMIAGTVSAAFEMLGDMVGATAPTPQRVQAAIEAREQAAEQQEIDLARFRIDSDYRRQVEAHEAQKIEEERRQYYEKQHERERER